MSLLSAEEREMRWSKPKIVEVSVGLEINSYACARLA
jgi:coenzyme PQQ precursor peptide PqqA